MARQSRGWHYRKPGDVEDCVLSCRCSGGVGASVIVVAIFDGMSETAAGQPTGPFTFMPKSLYLAGLDGDQGE